ncbi:MAG: low affinity iron permease family protein [Phycisphaeraceae bacterium]|nr:low affinity iron permease family protein [Phycisphaeraceae bacterium]
MTSHHRQQNETQTSNRSHRPSRPVVTGGNRHGASAWFGWLAQEASRWTGRPVTFCVAVATVVLWAALGPVFSFSDTWQLVINTGTTIITFLMVFLIQSTQNRDTAAMQIKLDELIRASKGAHNALLDLEELNEDDLSRIRRDYEKLAEESRHELQNGRQDTQTPEVG